MSMVSSVNCICLSSGRVVKSRGPAYEDVLPTESRKVSADILLSFFYVFVPVYGKGYLLCWYSVGWAWRSKVKVTVSWDISYQICGSTLM